MGTSLTAGAAWVDALSATLEPLIGRPVRVLNFGKAGATSRSGLETVDEVIVARPDMAIIEFGINDAGLHRHITLAESAVNLAAIVARLRAAIAEVRLFLMTMSPAIGLHAWLRPRLGRYYEVYQDLSERERVGLIDNRPHWKAMPRRELARALPDGRHVIPEYALSITLENVVRTIVRDYGVLSCVQAR